MVVLRWNDGQDPGQAAHAKPVWAVLRKRRRPEAAISLASLRVMPGEVVASSTLLEGEVDVAEAKPAKERRPWYRT